MRILIIGDFEYHQNLMTVLSRHNIADKQNILNVSNFEKAEEFIENQLSKGKRHIDLIIMADKIKNNFRDIHIVDWIRRSFLDFSEDNLKVSSLPIILYGKELRSGGNYLYGYNATVEQNSNDFHEVLFGVIRSVVSEFRGKILEDLDRLKIDIKKLQSGFNYSLDDRYNYKYARNAFSFSGNTEAISASFIRCPMKLPYDWLNFTLVQMEKGLSQYQSIFTNIKKYNRVNSEKLILHKLYNNDPWILQMDLYDKPIYEPSLMRNSTEYEEPDYILPSAFPEFIATNVTEVKPHLVPILQSRSRKPFFKQAFNDGAVQIYDYKRFLKTKKGRQELDKILSYSSGQIKYTLLSSNDSEMARNKSRINELMRDHYSGINLVTHDDKFQQAMDYYERSRYFSF